jgi:hypothetical protein
VSTQVQAEILDLTTAVSEKLTAEVRRWHSLSILYPESWHSAKSVLYTPGYQWVLSLMVLVGINPQQFCG